MSRNRIDPVIFVWRDVDFVDHEDGVVRSGMAMVPVKRYENFAARQFVAGNTYRLGPSEVQSEASRGHFFICIHLAWENLPEDVTPRWRDETHMRRWILIEKGWYHESEFVVADRDTALQLATYIEARNRYARFAVIDNKLIVREAMSQSPKAMGKNNFERSKQDVLGFLTNLLGIDVTTLKKEAKKYEKLVQ